MAELDHLSYSSLSVYQACARSWKFKYLDKLPSPTTPALAFGSAWHETIEQIIRMTASRKGVDVEAIWREALGQALLTVPAASFAVGDTALSLMEEGLQLLIHRDTVHALERIWPQMHDGQPVIEKRIELRVPGVPVPIIGYIDCVDVDGVPMDFKTSERSWAPDRAHGEIQSLFYLAALMQEGRASPGFRFRHIVFPKSGKVRVQVFEHTHTPAELFWLFGAIKDAWHGINAGTFHPNPSSWLCSEKYCAFWSSCRGKK